MQDPFCSLTVILWHLCRRQLTYSLLDERSEVIVQALAAIINYSSVTYLSKHLCLCCYLSTSFLP